MEKTMLTDEMVAKKTIIVEAHPERPLFKYHPSAPVENGEDVEMIIKRKGVVVYHEGWKLDTEKYPIPEGAGILIAAKLRLVETVIPE